MKQEQAYRIRVFALSLLGFLIIVSYGISRSAVDSLFLEQYSSSQLPTAWLLTAIFAGLIMTIYNRYNVNNSLLKIFGISSLLSAALLVVLLILLRYKAPGTLFLLHIWKEVYVILILEIFWTYANVVFSIQSARSSYGLLLAAGSFGGVAGSLFVGPAAKWLGTEATLWFVLPILLACYLISVIMSRLVVDHVPKEARSWQSRWTDGLHVLKNSKYLVPLLAVVLTVQIAITLLEFEYNSYLELAFPQTDVRTDMMGKIHATVDLLAVALQFLTSPILKFFGVARTMVGIPSIVGFACFLYMLVPQFATIVLARTASKSLDYSVFRTAKEILYIPLNRNEKTQGKAVIDIFTYRFAKGCSSIILMGLVAIGAQGAIMPIAFLFQLLWIALAIIIAKRYRSIVSFDEERNFHQSKQTAEA